MKRIKTPGSKNYTRCPVMNNLLVKQFYNSKNTVYTCSVAANINEIIKRNIKRYLK